MQLRQLKFPKRFLSTLGNLAVVGLLAIAMFSVEAKAANSNGSFVALPPNFNLDIQPNSLSNCGALTATLTIVNSEVGVSYQIFNGASPTGAAVIGTGGNIAITSGSIAVSTTLSIQATETFGAGLSGFLSETIPVTISTPPTTANAGPNQVNCGLSVALNANNPVIGTGTWTLVTGAGTASFANANQRNTLVTVSAQGSYTFRWTITNGSCVSTDEATIIFYAPPTTSNAGSDQLVCGLTATLAGNMPTNGNGAWFLVSGPGGVAFGNSTDPNTEMNVFITGTYTVQWLIFNGVCPFSSDQVVISFTDSELLADAGADDSVCALSTTLAGNDAGAQPSHWTQISGPGVASFGDATDANSSVNVTIGGVYVFAWTIENAPCPTSTDQVSIDFTLTTEVCDGIDNDCDLAIDEGFDVDGDTFTQCNGDCDDNDNTVYPGAPEICDGQDNDCDLAIDEGALITYYADNDGDTYGNPISTVQACSAPIGYVSDNNDCDDTDPNINPGEVEVCDGFDNNCNAAIDEGVQTTYYADNDGDTFGDAGNSTLACSQPVGFVLNSTDCDDTNPAINTSAVEVCDGFDNDCDTQIDEGVQTTYYADADNDTFGDPGNSTLACSQPAGFVLNNTDCDDTDPTINTSGVEVCDGADNDCDTQIDEGVLSTFYADTDSDTYGDPFNTVQACSVPAGYVADNTDCNDADNTVYPGAPELCDGQDNDCDIAIDESGNITFYADTDNDTYGDPSNTILACTAPAGYVSDNTDCDDTDAAVNPGANEVCDGADNNCNTLIDEGVQNTYYADADNDTYGNTAVSVLACTAPVGFVSNNTDCDDTNAAINPGAAEVCDGVDNNCNITIDEGVQTTFFADTDNDTYGDPTNTILACTVPVGYVSDNTDCDDTDPTINIAGVEVCDGADNNCNTTIDEGVQNTYYADTDNDTYGDTGNTILACSAPVGYVSDNTDCDDTDASINPAGTEVCDGADNDCDILIDETGNITFYADADNDTYGDPANTILACTAPAGYVSDNTDCDDTDAAINPGATEVCDGFDNNCNVTIDESGTNVFYADTDNDTYGDPTNTVLACTAPVGYVSDNTDCDDTDPSINIAGVEVCDGADNNCNTTIDEGVQNTYYADTDNDTYGDAGNTILACSTPVGYVSDNTDCDDSDASINPAGTEVCDGADNDCDILIDETGNITFYADTDNDTYGDPANTILACTAPVGYVSDNTDCDDTDAAINPGATEVCDGFDNNCNTTIDEGGTNVFYADADNDTYGDPTNTVLACTAPVGYVSDNTDCDDTDPTINIAGVEVCDGADNNCNTTIDEGVQNTYYADTDNDTYGDAANTILACSAPVGYVSDNTDCDDTDASINPAGTEVCDGADNDCDILIDETGNITFYADTDNDTYGDAANTILACTAPVGYVSDNTDCDDTDAAINPGVAEICDGVDNNCNVTIDEGVQITFYLDADNDTYGDAANSILACSEPVGYVSDNTDCDDTDATLNPGVAEVCDGIDNNCNVTIDEGVQTTFYADLDNDTYGDPLNTVLACTQPAGYVSDNTDCDDTDPTINIAGVEVCDGVDNNCNTTIDEGVQNTYYADVDNDTFGDPLNTILACSTPVGYVSDNTDCNDNNATVYPGATELCDGLDNNCDLTIDEGFVLTTFYADADFDTYGDLNNTIQACAAPPGYVSDNTDCDDSNGSIFPGAFETCNGADDDCDLAIDEGVQLVFYEDLDLDGFGTTANFILACSAPVGYSALDTDCNDNNNSVYPGAPELCDGLDNNCDLTIDEGVLLTFYADADNDTYGDNASTIQACSPPAGYVVDNTDCDDTNALINPGITEVCDGADNNCNFAIDETGTNTFYADADNDGFGDINMPFLACTAPFGYVADNTDCDDNNDQNYPGNIEICDGFDNNCDTQIDETGNLTFYADLDGDTYGDPANSVQACTAPVGYVSDNTDCDDTNPTMFPGNPELCDGFDNNCDTQIDESLVLTTFFADTDGDTFGDPTNTIDACVAPVGYVSDLTDCNDADNTVYPGAPELCDGLDNNCDLAIDEGLVLTTFYADADFDTYGDPNNTFDACVAPSGYVTDNTDCDDSNGTVFPGNPEVCDGLDNNCDLSIDEGLILTTYYADTDNDGYGDNNATLDACSQPIGYSLNNTDCNDADFSINEGALEVCDGLDNNCDTQIDEGFGTTTYYLDADVDGYGDPNSTIESCFQPLGYVLDDTDCDDTNFDINPSVLDLCDGFDNNCNITIDEDAVVNTYYADADGDTYGDLNSTTTGCSQPTGYVANSLDCDDTNDAINPDGIEVCDNIDNNCDTQIDEGLNTGDCADTDLDGVNDGNDNDDDNDGITDAAEMLTAQNAGDTDGDGVIDQFDSDSDGDGINDVIEGGGIDTDGDGYFGSGPITDVDGNGLDDSLDPDGLVPPDTDGDGLLNFQDLDSDGDGAIDADENDVDGDGIGPDDTDGDTTPNYLDLDDDGDGLDTSVELDYNGDGIMPDDCDYDGVPNYLDADQCELFIPEGFSPNNDNNNDLFVLEGLKAGTTINLQIFNRWGALVYASSNYQNDWNGQANQGSASGDLPSGTYFYIITVDGIAKENVGYITLWR